MYRLSKEELDEKIEFNKKNINDIKSIQNETHKMTKKNTGAIDEMLHSYDPDMCNVVRDIQIDVGNLKDKITSIENNDDITTVRYRECNKNTTSEEENKKITELAKKLAFVENMIRVNRIKDCKEIEIIGKKMDDIFDLISQLPSIDKTKEVKKPPPLVKKSLPPLVKKSPPVRAPRKRKRSEPTKKKKEEEEVKEESDKKKRKK